MFRLCWQVFSIREFSGCQGHRSRLTTLRTHSNEVRSQPNEHPTDILYLMNDDVSPGLHPGNDPLIDEESNHDINSVAGVLKLYFRGLENPLFPKERFNDLMSCISECHQSSSLSSAHKPSFPLVFFNHSFVAGFGAVCLSGPSAVVYRMCHLSYRLVMAPEWLTITSSCIFLTAGIENLYERAQCIRKILLGVPRATLVVMRYLFAFLNQWVSSHTKPAALIWWLFAIFLPVPEFPCGFKAEDGCEQHYWEGTEEHTCRDNKSELILFLQPLK